MHAEGTKCHAILPCDEMLTWFLFPIERTLPSHILGILSLLVLALVIPAPYVFHLAGACRRIYVIGATIALYLNVFVDIVQASLTPELKAIVPTQRVLSFLSVFATGFLSCLPFLRRRDSALIRYEPLD